MYKHSYRNDIFLKGFPSFSLESTNSHNFWVVSICKLHNQWECTQGTQIGALWQAEGWGGRELGGRGHVCTYGWFLLMYDRKSQNSVKQLSFNSTILKKRKEWNNATCSNTDGPRDYHAKWNKSEKHKYHMVSLFVESKDKMIQRNLLIGLAKKFVWAFLYHCTRKWMNNPIPTRNRFT